MATTCAVVALLGVAVAVRGIEGAPRVEPFDRPTEADAIREPLQFLGRGAALRIAELGPRISAESQTAWRAAYRAPFDLKDCPQTAEWLVTPAGQRLERLLGDLRRGTREDALAALALVFQLARATEWKPGLLAKTQHAEKLAGFAQDWLRAWSERAASEPVLAEPALATVLAYGLWMKRVSQPRPIGRRDEAYDRALAFLQSILRDGSGRPTALYEALRARHPGVVSGFEGGRDALDAFEAAALQLFPELNGECP
ncbi:MAG: hypothetical protein IT454_17275 [Planctomycetes bacterium]|nr:hypothetical protein [Planctomycetota bacterium]